MSKKGPTFRYYGRLNLLGGEAIVKHELCAQHPVATKRTNFASPPLDEIFQWTCHLQDRRVANYDECFLKLGGACACELRLPINPTPWDHILDRMARQEATSATPR